MNTFRPSDLLKIFEAIDTIRKAINNQVLNISELHVFGDAGFKHVDVVENQSVFASLPIASLYVDVERMRRDQLIVLLQTFKSTLRHLTLTSCSDDFVNEPYPKDMFPQGLTKLCLLGPIMSSLEFLSYTPNLEELLVDGFPCVLPSEMALVAVAPLVNLKKLTYSGRLSSEQMANLTKLMPNVIDCGCIVNAEGFQALCQGWPNLEHLDLTGRYDCTKENEGAFVEKLVQLKCLRSLRISEFIRTITDTSVFEAFLKMPCLTRIDVGIHVWIVKITEEGLQALEPKLSNDFVHEVRKYRQ